MLTYGLTNFDTINIAKKDEIFDELDVWQGTQKTIKSYINEDVYKTILKAKKKYLSNMYAMYLLNLYFNCVNN